MHKLIDCFLTNCQMFFKFQAWNSKLKGFENFCYPSSSFSWCFFAFILCKFCDIMLLNSLVHFHPFGVSSCALEHLSSSPCFCSVILHSWTFQFIFIFLWCHLVLLNMLVYFHVFVVPSCALYVPSVLELPMFICYLCFNNPKCLCILGSFTFYCIICVLVVLNVHVFFGSFKNPKFSRPSLCFDGPRCFSTTLYLGCPKFMLVEVLLLVLMTSVLLLVLVVTICPSFDSH